MSGKKLPLHLNLVELIKEKAGRVGASHQAEREMVELCEVLRKSYLVPPERVTAGRLLREIAGQLSSGGDERSAKAYLNEMVAEFAAPAEVTSNHLGRTA